MYTIAHLRNINPEGSQIYRLRISDHEADAKALNDFLSSRIPEHLEIDMRRLTDIPLILSHLTELKKLVLRVPSISEIKSSHLPSGLESITLKCSRLHKIHSSFWHTNMHTINLEIDWLEQQDCETSSVSESLTRLNLNIKNLTRLPSALNNHKLKWLHIKCDKLNEVPEKVISSTQLIDLSLDVKNIETPLIQNESQGLRTLNLNSDNPLDLSRVKISSALRVFQAWSPHTILPDFSQAIYLIRLNLRGLEGALDSGIGNCHNLMNLHISDSNLSRITPKINNLSKLRSFILEANMDNIPQEILQLPSLETFSLCLLYTSPSPRDRG